MRSIHLILIMALVGIFSLRLESQAQAYRSAPYFQLYKSFETAAEPFNIASLLSPSGGDAWIGVRCVDVLSLDQFYDATLFVGKFTKGDSSYSWTQIFAGVYKKDVSHETAHDSAEKVKFYNYTNDITKNTFGMSMQDVLFDYELFPQKTRYLRIRSSRDRYLIAVSDYFDPENSATLLCYAIK